MRVLRVCSQLRFSICLVFCCVAPLATALPTGFQNELVVSGIDQPVYLAQLPDGRMLVLSKLGTIYIFNPAQVPAQLSTYLTLTSVDTAGERGLTSIAIDPDFAISGAVYIYYTNLAAKRNRISRFIQTGNTADPSSEVVIWQNSEEVSDCCHYGGGLQFGPDGKLYLTTGEEFDGDQAQDMTRAGGKIIRINKDGSIPTDNPFIDGPGGNLDEIWAFGLRNPYRAHWDLVRNRMYISEVGGNVQSTAREDIHLGRAGANFGWPFCEGICGNPAWDDPIFSYGHTGGTPNGGAVTAGTVYRGNLFPAVYNEAFFFADYVLGFIRYLTFDASGNLTGNYDFATASDDLGAPVHVISGADGALYYANYYGSVHRIVYSSGNQAPSITAVNASATEGGVPLSVNFTASAFDLEGDPLTYSWSFGNGDTGQGQSVNYIYGTEGSFNAYVQVSDGDRSVISPLLNIQAGQRPIINIVSPADGDKFRAGEVIDFIGTATDPDGNLSESSYEWSIDFIHNAHTHPTLAGYSGSTGQFPINTAGHDYHDNTAYRLTLKVTDADGLVSTDTVTVYPDKVNLNITASPAGIPVYIDGIPLTTPFVYDTLIGFSHVISVPQSYCLNGQSYAFTGWASGGAATHPITVPASDYADTALYQDQGACLDVPASGLVFRVEGTTGVQASGGIVSGWLDQSGRGNHLTAVGNPTVISGGLNGKNVIDFDGSVDYLYRTTTLNGLPVGSQNRTMILLANYRGVGWGGVAYGDTSCNHAFGLGVDSQGRMGVENWCNFANTTQNVVGGGWILQTAVLSNNQVKHYKNADQVGTFSRTFDTQLTRLALGANLDTVRKMNMQIAAMFIYDRALSTSELTAVRQYIQQTYSVNVGGGNNIAPITQNDAASVQQGGSTTIDILANDSDSDGTLVASTVSILTQPAHGTISVDPGTGVVNYLHDGNGSAPDSFTYNVRDNGNLLSNTATVNLSVISTDPVAPVAGNDADTVFKGAYKIINVLANDGDINSNLNPGSVQIVGNPSAGSVSVNTTTGAVTYTHNGSSGSSDSFTYQVSDQSGLVSNVATVTLTILDSSSVVPSAGLVLRLEADQGVSTSGGIVTGWSDLSGMGNDLHQVTGDPALLSSSLNGHAVVDFDGGGDELRRTQTLNGLRAGSADRTLLLVVNYRGNGYGGFAYGNPSCHQTFGLGVTPTGKLMGQMWCSSDMISTITGTGAGWMVQALVVSGGAVTHYKDGTAIGTDQKVLNTVLNRIVMGAELDGTPQVNMQVAAAYIYDRALSPTELANAQTQLHAYYLAAATPQAPITQNDTASVVQGGTVLVNVLANDSDADDDLDAGSVTIATLPAHGSVSVDSVTGAVTYLHDGSSSATDSFTYQVSDLGGRTSSVATVSIAVSSSGMPSAGLVMRLEADQGVSATEGYVTGWNDLSGSGNHLTQVTGNPRWLVNALNGHAVVDFDGSGDELRRAANLTALPAGSANRTMLLVANYRGTGYGGFTYGQSACNQTFGLGVTPAGNLMVQGWCNDYPSTTLGTGTGWIVQAVVVSGGAITHYRDGTVIGTAQKNFNTVLNRIVLGAEIDGAPQVNMQVAAAYIYDRALTSTEIASAQTQLRSYYLEAASSQPPQAQNDTVDVVQGNTVAINVLANDSDADGTLAASTVTIVQAPVNGVATVDAATGIISYSHGGASTIPDSFTYSVQDNAGLTSNTATVSVGVLIPNAVVNITSPYSGQTISGPTVVVTYQLSGTDYDHLHLSIDGLGHNTIRDLTGTFTFTDVAPGTHTITAQLVNSAHQPLVTDAAVDDVTFNVVYAAAAPVAVNDAAAVAQSGSTLIDVLANDSDINANLDPASVEIVSSPGSGSVSVDPVTGAVTYQHNGSAGATDSFTYRVHDLDALISNIATVSITVASDDAVPAAGLVMRLEADQGVSVTSGIVTGWSDLSGKGNGLNLVSGAPLLLANGPNGHAAVDFDGVGDMLQRTADFTDLPAGNANRTMLVVVNYRGRGYGGFTYGNTECSQAFGLGVSKYGKLTLQGWCQSDIVSSVTGTNAGWMIHAVVMSNGAVRQYKNSTAFAPVNRTFNTAANRIVLGAELDGDPQVKMQVAAAYIYDRALSDQEMSDLITTLGERFGIAP